MRKIILMLMLLAGALTLCACNPVAPTSYPGTVWVCEEPYMRFVSSQDEVGTTGIGEIQTEDGDTIAVRFGFTRGACYICQDGDCFETEEDGEIHPEFPIGLAIIDGDYKMSRYGTVMKIAIRNDEIYNGKYKTLTFRLQKQDGAQN